MPKGIEIERKYLIAMPDTAALRKQPGCAVWEIEQIYLTADEGTTRRIRSVSENGQIRLFRTFKRRIDALSAIEEEAEIGRDEFEALRKEANDQCSPVHKVRYRVPYDGQLLEFDIYPFWNDRAVVEVELEGEDQQVRLPGWVHVFKDVTDDVRYRNFRLSKDIPMDDLSE